MKFYRNLTNRDRKAVKLGAAAAALMVFVFFVLLPLKEKGELYERRVAAKEKTVAEVAAMSVRYMELEGRLDDLRKKARSERSDFTLFSFLDRAAGESGLKGNIKAMKPSVQSGEDYTESVVVVELEDVMLKPLVKYIHRIETSGHNLRITNADIKPRYTSPGRMNVTLLISAIELK